MSEEETPRAPVTDQKAHRAPRSYHKWIWVFIALYTFMTIFTRFSLDPLIGGIQTIIYTLLVVLLAGFHGVQRYGLRNLLIFFLITWVVSFSFESLSIHTGVPFGWYYYAMPAAISLLGVPLIIIFAYFSTGYFAWMLAHIFSGRYAERPHGKWLFVVPFVSAFLMVMWDVSMDPVSSTLYHEWAWLQPGVYFGVPIQNFFGWFLVVFIFYLIFTLFLSKFDRVNPLRMPTLTGKLYWTEAAVVYGILGLNTVFLVRSMNNDITQSMALIATFTMIIVAILAYLVTYNDKELT